MALGPCSGTHVPCSFHKFVLVALGLQLAIIIIIILGRRVETLSRSEFRQNARPTKRKAEGPRSVLER